MRRSHSIPHTAATIALSMLAAATIIGGCNQQSVHITQVTPKPGSCSVPTSTASVEVVFDTAMHQQSVQTAYRISPVEGLGQPRFTWTTDSHKCTVTYPRGFRTNTVYTVLIGKEARSANGGSLPSQHKFRFVTSGGSFRDVSSAKP